MGNLWREIERFLEVRQNGNSQLAGENGSENDGCQPNEHHNQPFPISVYECDKQKNKYDEIKPV
ncbi:hypothetical protein SDC9_163575 [bioreactor metagenome]|uniref:Uncharacterized protein n=1 Tax=bioreactor metagenome TaxID=1076179 RepID=A0A645FP82_9ZZZZ